MYAFDERGASALKYLKVRLRFLLIIGLFGLASPIWSPLVYAQDIPEISKSKFGWMNLGLGLGSSGASGNIGFSYQTGNHLISIRAAGTAPITFFVGCSVEVFDVGVLYWKSMKTTRNSVVWISGGIAHVGGKGCNFEGRREEFSTIGVPFQIQTFAASPFIGIGFILFGNVNPEAPFVGVALALQL